MATNFRRSLALALAAACAIASVAYTSTLETVAGYTARTARAARGVADWMVSCVTLAVVAVAAKMPRLSLAMPLPGVSRVQLLMRDYVQRRQHVQRPTKRPTWSLCPST